MMSDPSKHPDFKPVSLSEFEAAGLLRRRETKYLLHQSALPSLLDRIRGNFLQLQDAGTESFRYETDYYDTASLQCYRDHLHDVPNRVKVRVRRYLDTGLRMFEIKQKSGAGRIRKTRRRLEAGDEPLSPLATMPPIAVLGNERLAFRLQTRYLRSSYLARDRSHRLTIDTAIEMQAADGRMVALPGLAVIELKSGPDTAPAALTRSLLTSDGGVQTPFSKYMLGMSLLFPELASGIHNSRLQAMRRVQIQPKFA